MPWSAVPPLILVGLAAGLLSALFGVGGGVVIVPALGLLLHLDQHLAQGTSLMVIVPTAAWGAFRYARRGSIRWGASLRVGIPALVVSFLAAHLALRLPSALLRALFAVFLVAVAARAAWTRRQPAATPTPHNRGQWVQVALGVGVGALSGLLGVGGGVLATPGLVLLSGFPAQLAQGTSLGALVLSSGAGVVGYAGAGAVDWLAAAAIFLGALATVPLGAYLAHRLPERRLRQAFAVFALAMAVWEVASRI